MKLSYIFSLILVFFVTKNTFAFISTTYYTTLYNANSEDIALHMFDYKFNAVIESFNFEKFAGLFNTTLILRIKDEKFFYEVPSPPHQYGRPGVLSIDVKLIFTVERKFYLIEQEIDLKKIDAENWRDFIALQPEGWPLEPKE